MPLLLRALLLAAAALATGLIHRTPPSSHLAGIPRSAAALSRASGDARLLQLASARLGRQRSREVIRWLRSQSLVRAVASGRDGQTLDVRFRDGVHAAILPASSGAAAASDRVFRWRARPLALERSPGAGRALVLEPFASELLLGPTAGNAEMSDLQAAGFQVDAARDTTVTIQTMTSLSRYNVVYMHTHSGVDQSGEGVIATGQPANGDPSVAPFLQSGSVMPVGVAGSTQLYYGITSRFIRTYEGPFPANALLFVNGCSLLSAPLFWQALASRGAGVLVSWNQEATSMDNFLSAAAFFSNMDQGMPVSGAIAAEQAAGYGKSTVNGQPAVLGYLGDGTITLRSAMQPVPSRTSTPTATRTPHPPAPTPTSAPTPTRTARSATPTPASATSTPASAPPLKVTLKSQVSPGADQVIAVRSSPNTAVQLRVSFPNGDSHSWASTTDAAGIVHFVYVQAPSMITRNRVFASVAIVASNGSATSTRTASYKINWGKIDVSVEPREQSAGRSVTIWVHTQPHTRVSLALGTSRKGKTAHLARWAGPRGWVHVRYRIAQAAKGRVIAVQGTARIGRFTYHTQTSILVK